MMNTPIINYLPSAAIVLLTVMALVLLVMLIYSRKRCRELSILVDELHRKEQMTITLGEQQTDTADGIEKKFVEKGECEEFAVEKMELASNKVFIAYIDQLILRNIAKNDFTAATVTKVLCLSRTQLDRRMKLVVGKTIAAYLLEKRMTYARELLLTTDMPIAEVAMACGYEDTSYFSRVFRGCFNNTPSEVRKGE